MVFGWMVGCLVGGGGQGVVEVVLPLLSIVATTPSPSSGVQKGVDYKDYLFFRMTFWSSFSISFFASLLLSPVALDVASAVHRVLPVVLSSTIAM